MWQSLYHPILDINECDLELDDCDQICTNVMGSFECGCSEGYTLASERSTTCVDIDECALDLHNCQQGCENTIGGFRCTCFNGYELNPDQITCTGNITMIVIIGNFTFLLLFQVLVLFFPC